MIEGRLTRAMAMIVPGMFLSQPGSEMLASYHWAPITVSMLSAIKSRDCRLKDMPSVPIDWPSLTPMVLNIKPTMPWSCTPALTVSARDSRCMLQGLLSYHTDEMPTCRRKHMTSIDYW